MEVKLLKQSAWLLSITLVLSLGQSSLASADEATASDGDARSTIFISDDAPNDPPSVPQLIPPQSAEGSLVFIDNTQTASATATAGQVTTKPSPALIAPMQADARGELTVVSDQSPKATLAALRPMPKQQPLAAIVQQPVVPKPAVQPIAPVEHVSAPIERDQPGDIQIAIHTEPIAIVATDQGPTTTTVEQLLISAHKQSRQSNSVTDYTEIIESCSEAIRRGAKGDKRVFARQLSSWALNRRGHLHAEEGEQEFADADFQTALDFNAKNWRALHNRGVSFAQAGQFAEAFDDFNAVLRLNPSYAKAYANRATLYVQTKDLQAAIKDYEQAIQRDDQFATAYVGLGRVYHMLGRWDDAIEYFSAAVQLEPTNPEIVCSRGDLQSDMRHYSKALADYARSLELDPEFAHAYRNGAWLLATCPDERYRDPENAVVGAQQALEYSYGDRHVALDTLAAALASNGQFEEAVATVTQAVDIAPEDVKFTYLSRLQLYQDGEPFRTEPIGDVSQAMYEASDQ